MKRACILFFYDKDGIADEYNFYNLEELRTVCDYILVVINGSRKQRPPCGRMR